jgi:hypothetical protein
MAAVDLSGKAVYTQAITADPRSGVMRKRDVMAPAEPPPAAAAKPAAAPKPAAPQQAAPKPPPQRQTTPQRPVGR